jgi:hypothetical protein
MSPPTANHAGIQVATSTIPGIYAIKADYAARIYVGFSV